MSTMQRLTLIGLYNYNPDLFDALTLPDGYDKETFVDSLLLEHGEKCVLYANPDFMRNAIGAWGRKWAGNLERIYTALTEEYNPLHNFDRFEEYTDNEGTKRESKTNAGRKVESKTNAGHKATDSPNYDDNITNDYDVVTDTNNNRTVETQTSAFNSSNYEPSEKVIENGGKTTVSNDGTIKRHIDGKTQNLSETSNSTTNDSETANTTVNDAETHNFTHKGHLYGNIGVTTSVQMLTSEVDARMKYNLYDAAGRLFANELLIGIY